jgi:regulator of cell morphogenesis and NO signaling
MQFAADGDSMLDGKAGQHHWGDAPLSALIGHIVSVHHEFLKTELPRVEKLLEVAYSVHRATDSATLAPLPGIFFLMKDELDLHMHKEEAMLFPAIEEAERAATGGYAASHVAALRYPISVMLGEHESATSTRQQIRKITRDYALPTRASDLYCALFLGFEALERDLECHVRLENEILFPRAMALQS